MSGFDNDVMYSNNADFSTAGAGGGSESNGLITNGQLWIGRTAVNAGGTHIDVGTLTGGTGVTITNGPGSITIGLSGGGAAIDSFIPDSGTSPVVPNGAGAVTLAGSGSITTVGGLNTLTTQLTGLTNHAVLIGAGTTTITKVGPVASTGCVLQSNGVGSDPGFSTATYPSTTTINEVLYSSANNVVSAITAANNGTMISGATGVPSWLANGSTGQVLTATTGSPPSWAPGASGDVTGPGSSTDRAIATWNGTGGDTLYDNSTVQISSAGEMTNTTQPAFLAYQASTASNVTGTSTAYQLGSTVDLTETFDQGSDFDPTVARFTAPVTGRYFLTVQSELVGNTVASFFGAQISTSNMAFQFEEFRSASNSNNGIGGATLCDMDAADTAVFFISATGEAGNTSDVYGQAGTPRYTWVSGYLVC